MGVVGEQIAFFRNCLPAGVKLVAVSKFKPVEAVMEAYEAGQRVFGESRPLEFQDKARQFPDDIEWHFIGHLQTNKLGKVLPYVSMVESIDSLHLLEAVSAWCVAHGKVMDVLLELHLGAEETKGGFSAEEIRSVVGRAGDFPGVRFCGLMGMATNTRDEAVIRADFRRIAALFREIAGGAGGGAGDGASGGPAGGGSAAGGAVAVAGGSGDDVVAGAGAVSGGERPLLTAFRELSIGMSGDYLIAQEEGSTLVRVGTAIFGEREAR